jgi:bacteriocin-like protein
MKKLTVNEMKQVKGGDGLIYCRQQCLAGYYYCLQYSGDDCNAQFYDCIEGCDSPF